MPRDAYEPSPARELPSASGIRGRLSKRDWMIAFLLAALTLALRAAGSRFIDLSADEGVVGIMGLDILAGRAPTCYWYGQEYMGTLESILAAPFIAALGPTVAALRAPSLVAAALAVFLIYLFLARYCGGWAALTAAVLIAIAPVSFYDITIRARGYGVTLPLLVGMLWAASEPGRLGGLRGAVTGAIASLAYWLNPQTLQVTLPVLILAAIYSRSWRSVAMMAVGAAAGMTPSVWHYLLAGTFMTTPPMRFDGVAAVLASLPRRSIASLGAGDAASSMVRASTGAAVWLFLLSGAVLYLRGRRKKGGARALDALLAAPFGGFGLLAVTGTPYVPERYYYLIYLALVVLACAGWQTLKNRRAALLAAALVVAANGAGLFLYHHNMPWRTEYLSLDEYTKVLTVLEEEGVRNVVTDYGADYSIMYLTGRDVAAAPVPIGSKWVTRIAEASAQVKNASRFAVVLSEQPAHERLKDHMKPEVFDQFLRETNRHADIRRLGRVAVYTRIERMASALDIQEYGRWVLERYPKLREYPGADG